MCRRTIEEVDEGIETEVVCRTGVRRPKWIRVEVRSNPEVVVMNLADAAGALEAARTTRRRILLAEDVDSNALWEQDALEHFGFDVLRVADGAKAVAWGTRTAFDLILMDCRMPVMDGATATQAIRDFEAATRRTRTPIVAVTASVMPADRQRWLEAGMDDVLAKPVLLEEL